MDEERCRTRVGLAPGEYVLLTVSDTGVGMDETTRGQVFEPFFTTKPEGKGTGLGLATVYGIVKQNGGFIDVRSEPGHGTTFEVYLPRSSEAAERPAEKGDERPLTGTETVLIVEDELALLQIVRETLESLGYTVLVASSPGDAVLLCETYPGEIHVLLTDVVMPTMNGNELRGRLERIKPGLRTVLMSGYTADAMTQHEIMDRGQCFIQKPFTREALASKIREALQG
jgi:CheY-like chemotaxis protein